MYSGFINNHHILEDTLQQVNKLMIHPENEVLLSNKKEQSIDLCS